MNTETCRPGLRWHAQECELLTSLAMFLMRLLTQISAVEWQKSHC